MKLDFNSDTRTSSGEIGAGVVIHSLISRIVNFKSLLNSGRKYQ